MGNINVVFWIFCLELSTANLLHYIFAMYHLLI